MLIREIVSLVLFHIVIILKEKTLDNYERFFYRVYNLRNLERDKDIHYQKDNNITLS